MNKMAYRKSFLLLITPLPETDINKVNYFVKLYLQFYFVLWKINIKSNIKIQLQFRYLVTF